MPTAYINIGSNQGDRRANIARAVALIADTLHVKPQLSSAIEPSISPASHRKPDGSYADRIIDIDLIAYGDTAIDMTQTPSGNSLTLPHPRMHLRKFVLLPMLRLAPEWTHPVTGLTPADMLQKLKIV